MSTLLERIQSGERLSKEDYEEIHQAAVYREVRSRFIPDNEHRILDAEMKRRERASKESAE